MRFLVVGSGLMGFAAAVELARGPEAETVTLADAILIIAQGAVRGEALDGEPVAVEAGGS